MKVPVRSLLVRCILMALGAPAWMLSTDVAAQAADSDEAALMRIQGLAEIVVTARRKEENLQDVPTSITAIGAKDLADLKIDGLIGVARHIPNVDIRQQAGSMVAVSHFRGITNSSLNPQVDAGIGIYVDGVYLGRLSATAFDIADLAQVEVMRGPQGTLFGRNSTGGAVNLITTSPSGQFGFHGELGFGNFNDRRQKFSLDLPEWNGLSARVTLGHHQNDGYVRNSAPRNTYHFSDGFDSMTISETGGANDNDLALISLRYAGVPGLKLDYKYDYSKNRMTIPYRQSMSLAPQTPPAGFVEVSAPMGFHFMESLPAAFESPSIMKVEGHSITAEYELAPELSAKYIGGFRKFDISYGLDGYYGAGLWSDGIRYWSPGISLREEDQHQSSHEFQLLGKRGNLDWIAGLFLFEEKAKLDNPILPGPFFGGIAPEVTYTLNPDTDYYIGQKVKTDNQSQALYVHGTWHRDQWDFSGGLRRTWDDRQEHVMAAGHLDLRPWGVPVFLPGTNGRDFRYRGSHNDYDLSATYRIAPGMNVYAKYATGFVSGGILQGTAFQPETAKSYEAGFKGSFMDNSLRFNAALYEMKRRDLQIEGFAATGYVLQNVGKSRSDGVELELTYVPMEGLTLNGSYGYTRVKTDGQIRTSQPRQTASFGFDYEFQRLANGVRPSFRMDASWRDDIRHLSCPAGLSQVALGCGTLDAYGNPEIANPTLDRQAIVKAQTLLSARFTLREIRLGAHGTAAVSLWGRNLLNNDKPDYIYTLGGNNITGTFQQPRTYGIDLSVGY
ncbi:TonB-dependent receptor [Denitratisoma oestradiolicum]|uniref:Iron complex outermembrane recepter protein n=1 Tax=Denitratisoma oestradiolicum TaxID=311182 RepID=A0A6S6XTL6_9PROT|nr:TonB-dependent receptor [Denitratisoma oestradiolicum]TWO80254.1 hypothetical protein CBW56_10600 [Denitratisoma oestradiolicum]CAB1369345.1 Iron complex outermembrane recepter protein [Denitratisoma oestradiolicum]